MKKSLFLPLVLGLVIFLGYSSARAIPVIEVAITPTSQQVQLGNPVEVALTISGLGNFQPDSLSVFDIDVAFDSSILSFNNVIYGDPVLGDQLDILVFGVPTTTTPGVGTVNLFELSLDAPGVLDTIQAGSFTLATITFATLALGTSGIDPSIIALGDSLGSALVGVVTSSGSVNVVPEPSTMLLLGSGLAGLGFFRWRRKREA